ncbi:CopG family ribbon-helix-helix protein [Shinella zoogloeoides]|uniref:CopG family ribbon-helix-helix protein n=1 Tax=Shinella zoogloeoides TaxID=352475 RepID=UPI00273D1CBC|nr:ribbon-helix-helix protein, CopG family [Shinella zoogloeoides]WLR93438.1 ribbon-helix-helix protein, CopG family [Shinella zoogloeoides]
MENQRSLSDPITLRLPSDLLGDIEAIARISGRSRSWVMVRAMKAYLAAEGQEILELDRARQAAAQEGATELDDLLAELDGNLPGNAA